ncbi:sulfite exporter TauE/SafE family protein [Crassaminicella thermophila]|uniref:Probable membrane transporter protein n=1 Tax=Crassaminicella thermophila TaxID=2599308 RepID=A0A5C0SG92_CRATE|nr:sulfite exporter TauE/SafE family protein [Crassaminicella thermophila]QEK12404.1 sulfite exporter TauE/SafE family protein [Crassaminicella thermophila]
MKKKMFTLKFILLGFIAGLINGLLGSGGGTILVPGMFFLLDIEEHKAHATAISVILPLALVSAFIYIKHGVIVWNITFKIMIGGILGGYIGANLLSKIPGNLLRKIFAIFMIIAAIRMVF